MSDPITRHGGRAVCRQALDDLWAVHAELLGLRLHSQARAQAAVATGAAPELQSDLYDAWQTAERAHEASLRDVYLFVEGHLTVCHSQAHRAY